HRMVRKPGQTDERNEGAEHKQQHDSSAKSHPFQQGQPIKDFLTNPLQEPLTEPLTEPFHGPTSFCFMNMIRFGKVCAFKEKVPFYVFPFFEYNNRNEVRRSTHRN